MYCVRILYPNKPGSTFDWKHYYATHLPLGLSLLAKHKALRPLRVQVDENKAAPGGAVTGPHHCICSLFFAQRREAETMLSLFAIEDARRQLTEDWPKYTQANPEIEICEVIEADVVTGQPRAA